MSIETKTNTDLIFTWLTRVSAILLTIISTLMLNIFSEVKADVKQLLKEHEEVKTKVEYLWTLETRNTQRENRNP